MEVKCCYFCKNFEKCRNRCPNDPERCQFCSWHCDNECPNFSMDITKKLSRESIKTMPVRVEGRKLVIEVKFGEDWEIGEIVDGNLDERQLNGKFLYKIKCDFGTEVIVASKIRDLDKDKLIGEHVEKL